MKLPEALTAEFDAVSSFIERHTQAVCPNCEKVCCIDRHGTYEKEDIVFLSAIGELRHDVRPKEPDTEPCRFLSPVGCGLPRIRRPFRCTWYFCTALLDEMQGGNPREYRKFIAELNRLLEHRRDVLEYTLSGRSAAW